MLKPTVTIGYCGPGSGTPVAWRGSAEGPGGERFGAVDWLDGGWWGAHGLRRGYCSEACWQGEVFLLRVSW
ncbi:MAG: hypothetical protein QXV47_06455 [Fervidicoccaceae archaeon]